MEEKMMNEKIDSEVLPYKSSFAKSIVVNFRDLKTMDTDNNEVKIGNNVAECNKSFLDNTGIILTDINNIISPKMTLTMDETKNLELDQLRKQCQDLNEENQRLQNLLQTNQTPRVQVIDNVLLQTQIDTLRWQMKQNEASQQMYRSLMRQMLNFLERARKSLDIIHERTSPTGKNKSSRQCRSLSVYVDEPEIIKSSSIPNSKFTRAKSITQISTSNGYSGIRDFTWSVLRRNDTSNCTTPRTKQDKLINKSHDGVVYRRANNNEPSEEDCDDDHVPPHKLSQEAFRLMRTIESLLATRELDLATISSSPFSSTLSSASSASSLSIIDKDSNNNKKDLLTIPRYQENENKRINSLSTNDGSFIDDEFSFKQIDDIFIETDENNKKIEKNDLKNRSNVSKKLFSTNSSSNIRLQINKTATIKEDELSIIRDEKQSSIIANSADDESGFSSMNSFQDVGIPVTTISPINNPVGLHTEIGLPEVPLDKNLHRRWASNPIDLQSKLKNYKNGYINNRAKVEQRSVWV